MTVVDEQIAAQLLTLTSVVPTPVEPYGYGVDLACTSDLEPDLAEVDPNSVQAIAQALLRRLITPNGGLLDDADYGEDIRGAQNRGTTLQDLNTLGSKIKNECQKDDRVESVIVSSNFTIATRTLTIVIEVEPVDAVRIFTMTLAVVDGTALLESIQ
jgi:hypothetical protein